jgi:protein ImuB
VRRRQRRDQLERVGQSQPILLVAMTRGRQTVARCCVPSTDVGIVPGMDLGHAMALLPTRDAWVLDHQPAEDDRALVRLARWAVRFTPQVAADPPDGLLLDITGTERLYGSNVSLMDRVAAALQRFGLSCRVAVAPTLGGAWALARFGRHRVCVSDLTSLRSMLNDLPIEALRVTDSVVEALAEVAIRRVGQLKSLGRGPLARRFGSQLLLRWDQAAGQAFELFESVRLHEPLQVDQTFAGPVKRLDAIEQTVHALIDRLVEALAIRHLGLTRLHLKVDRFEAEPVVREVVLSGASRDPDHLRLLLQPIVERLPLGHGLERVILDAAGTSNLRYDQKTLIESDTTDGATQKGMIERLVDRFSERFGRDQIYQMGLISSHVPEKAFEWQSAMGRPIQEASERRTAATVPEGDRPSRLYGSPRSVDVVAMSPDGPVLGIGRGDRQRQVRCSIGPERIAMPWWSGPGSFCGASLRDYFKLQDEVGDWWWIYRDVVNGGWFVHGCWV